MGELPVIKGGTSPNAPLVGNLPPIAGWWQAAANRKWKECECRHFGSPPLKNMSIVGALNPERRQRLYNTVQYRSGGTPVGPTLHFPVPWSSVAGAESSAQRANYRYRYPLYSRQSRRACCSMSSACVGANWKIESVAPVLHFQNQFGAIIFCKNTTLGSCDTHLRE